MKVNIFLNGEHFNGEISSADFNIACDGAYEYCKKNNIKIDAVLGDFDSLGYVPNDAIIYNKNKDFTDGEGAINFIKDKAESIIFYNFGGNREDHFLGNLSLLVKCFNLNIQAKAITNFSEIYYVKDKIKLKNVLNKTISIVPFGESAHIIKSRGLMYPADNLTFSNDKTLGISNVATLNEVELSLDKGSVFIVVNRR